MSIPSVRILPVLMSAYIRYICGCVFVLFISVAQANNALIQAVYDNDINTVISLLRGDIDIDTADAKYGYTPLLWASHNGNTQIVDALLSAGATPNVTGKDGNTPLIWAVHKNNASIVKSLVSAGANVNVGNADNRVPLIWALQNNNTHIINLLASAGANVNVKDSNGNTPLEWAINDNNLTVLKILVVAGADVNAKNVYGVAPLIATINSHKTQMAKILIAGKADVDIAYKGTPALAWAVQANNTELIRILVRRGAKIDYLDTHGNTLLILATQQNNPDAVAAFIDVGGSVHTQNKYGVNALTIATRQDFTDIIRILKTAGATLPNTLGKTANIQGTFLYRNRNYGLPPENLIRLFDGMDTITLLHEMIHLYFHQYEMWAKNSPYHRQQMQHILAYVDNNSGFHSGFHSGFLSKDAHEILVEAALQWLFADNPMRLPIVDRHVYDSRQNASLPQGVQVSLTPAITAVLQNMFATYRAYGNPHIHSQIKNTLSPFANGAVLDSNVKLFMAFLQTQSARLNTPVAALWQQINLRVVREQKFSEKLPLTALEKRTIQQNKGKIRR